MQRSAKRRICTLLSAIALPLALALTAAPAAASASCYLYVSPNGTDSAVGTLGAPFQTVQHLVNSLSSGQTGCLLSGTFATEEVKISSPGITLTSAPGATATLQTRLWVAADGVTVQNMNLDGRNARILPSPVTTAANDTFNNLDVTNHHQSICFMVGDADYGYSHNAVIENSRIHDCGRLPDQNQDHGIYVGYSYNAIVRNNWIYDNVDRGVQIYPDAHGTEVTGNVINANGEGVTISGDGSTASSNNTVENNIISNSNTRWNVESNWPNNLVGAGNVVRNNCVFASNSSSYYNQDGGITSETPQGFTASNNVTANPQFVDASAKNFNLQSGSPCAFVNGTASPTPGVTLQGTATSSGNVNLSGTATPAQSGSTVKIVIRKHHHLVHFAHASINSHGTFKVRKHLSSVQAKTKLQFRAIVAGVGSSPSLSLRIR